MAAGLDHYLDRLAERPHESARFSGYVLVTQDSKTVYERALGWADRAQNLPFDGDTNFGVGSITKQFTATAILKLQEAGKLQTTDTIAQHLPGYPASVANRVTIHHLLSHTSGIPNPTQLDQDRTVGQIDGFATALELFRDLPLEFEPGSAFAFSNSGYVILGAIIEAASGRSYGDFLTAALWAPAGLTRTDYLSTRQLENQARGYEVSERDEIVDARPFNAGFVSSASSVRSTANDLVRWDAALRSGPLLTPESLEKLYQPNEAMYAYGWMVFEDAGHRVIMHGGDISGFNTNYIRLPDDGIVIVIGTNVPSLHTERIGQAAVQLLTGQPFEGPELPTYVEFSGVAARPCAGDYVLTDEARAALVAGGVPSWALRVLANVSVTVNTDGLTIAFAHETPVRAYPIAQHRYTNERMGMTFSFERSDAAPNTVSHLVFGQGGLEARYRRVSAPVAQ